MSRQTTKRAVAIDSDFTELERKAANVGSQITALTSELQIAVLFLHDSVVNGKSDLNEVDRKAFRDVIIPIYEQLGLDMVKMQELFAIHSDDPTTYYQNVESYKLQYPQKWTEAQNRYPSVD